MRARPVTRDDAEAVRAIYNREVLGSTVTFDLVARSLAEQLEWIDEHSGAHPAIVAVDDEDRVRGFASLSPYRTRPAYRTTVEDSVYVDRASRGTGIGHLLLSEVVALAGAHGFHAVMARVVGNHEASIRLHRSCGFELVGVEREVGRKFGKWLDVALMQRLLREPASAAQSPWPSGWVECHAQAEARMSERR
ncbi:MAG: GNAT family N-acetyltransferase [Acidimicrobiales bacterium]